MTVSADGQRGVAELEEAEIHLVSVDFFAR